MTPPARLANSTVLVDACGRRYLGDRRPYRYHPHADNQEHAVTQSDTLAALAGHYFAPLPRACGFWWAIADFQPSPILNPLVPLREEYHTLVIPSLRVLTDIIVPGAWPARGHL